jgi:spermidine/putrescine transport system substrate-binding protein
MYENNEDLAFYYPKEGTNRFIDAACVLKTSKHQEAAALYINFLMDPEIARANAEYMYYASPNTAVIENEEYLEFLDSLHPDAFDILYGSVSDIPTDAFENLSPEIKSYMAEKWTKLGATITEENGNEAVYIVFALVVLLISVLFGINTYKKIKREKESNL